MKRFLCLLLCLGVLFSFCFARAELEVPRLDPTQQELQRSFIGNLFSFLPSLDIEEKALQLDVSQANEALLSALFQQVDGVFDLNGTVAGMPLRAQFTSDAILVSYEDQVYRLPYENLRVLVMGDQQEGAASIDPMVLYQLLQTFVESAILPSVTVESAEDATHVVVDLTPERLAEGLVGLGDAVAENEQLLKLLGIYGLSDFAEAWPELREMLQGGIVDISLKADATLEGDTAKLDAQGAFFGAALNLTANVEGSAAEFQLAVDGVMTMSGKANLATGAYECHGAGDGVDYDVTYAPTDAGWSYGFHVDAGEFAVLSCEAALTEAGFDADFSCLSNGEALTGNIHFDRATSALAANVTFPPSMGSVVFDIVGEATETGYHVVTNVIQGGETISVVDAVYTDTDEVVGLEVKVTAAGDAPEALMTLTAAYAKLSGAFELDYEDVSGNYCTGKGVMTATRQTGTVDFGRNGRVQQRFVLDRRSDDKVYAYRFTVYEESYYNGLDIVSDMIFDLDKDTGAFRGTFQQSTSKYDFQGAVGDGLFRLRFDANEYGRFAGTLELGAQWDDGCVTADLKYNDGYDATSANLLWTPALKTLSLDGGRESVLVSLQQDRYGAPQAFRLLVANGGYDTTEVSIDARRILINTDGNTTIITGGFRDSNTYRVDIGGSQSYRLVPSFFQIDFNVRSDAISITATDSDGQKVFEATLTSVEQSGFEALDGREGVIEITPELIQSMIESIENGGMDYEEEEAVEEVMGD